MSICYVTNYALPGFQENSFAGGLQTMSLAQSFLAIRAIVTMLAYRPSPMVSLT